MFLTGTNNLVFLLVYNAIGLINVAIIIEVIISWSLMMGARGINPYAPWVRTLHQVTDPILTPLRRLIPPRATGGWDLSPMIAIFLLNTLQNLLRGA